jgi:hypothetical protein
MCVVDPFPLTVKYTGFCASAMPFDWSAAVIPVGLLYVVLAEDCARVSVVVAGLTVKSLPWADAPEYVVPLAVPPAYEAVTLYAPGDSASGIVTVAEPSLPVVTSFACVPTCTATAWFGMPKPPDCRLTVNVIGDW